MVQAKPRFCAAQPDLRKPAPQRAENGILKTAQCAVLPFEVSERISPRER